MHKLKAEITEIFSSIQGEGIFLGARQIFIRFKHCNLACRYCDESRTIPAKEYSPLELMKEVKLLDISDGPHHSVSLTGGEPLLYANFLKIFLKILKQNRNFKSYLETNGTLPGELSKIIEFVDIVAMDFKLPSSTGERPFWSEHLEFLRMASKKKVFVKAVVTENTTKEDIAKAVEIIKKTRKNISLVLQPATPTAKGENDINKEKLLGFLEVGLKRMDNIRIIPQIHKILNVK